MFSYYTAEEQYIEKYFQLPKVFFEDERYINLSNDSKIAYAILKDRFNYSIKNNWVDDEDRIYFIYTNKELEKILNVSNKTVVKIKKELESVHLLVQEQQGLNKANLLYLGKPSVNSANSYQKKAKTLDTKGSVNFTRPENTPQTLDTKGSVNFTRPENTPQTLDTKGSVNFTHNLYLNNLDTLQDTLLDTDQTSNLNLDAISQQIDLENEFARIPKQAKQTLLAFGQNDEDLVYKQFGMIFRAKKEISEKYNCSLLLENFEDEFNFQTKVIANEIFKAKKGSRSIDNVDNFFYGSFKKFFEQQAERIQFKQEIKDEVLPDVPMVNWLE